MECSGRTGKRTRISSDLWGVRTRARAFTLVELMVVIAVIALVTAIVVPSALRATQQSHRTTCIANLKSLGQALAVFHTDYDCYPPDHSEYLWSPAAVKEYQRLYPKAPQPTNDPLGTLTGAAYYPTDPAVEPNPSKQGKPFAPDPSFTSYKPGTEMHGLGLFTLYYLGAYASVLPPRSSDPRFPRLGGRGLCGESRLLPTERLSPVLVVPRERVYHPVEGLSLSRERRGPRSHHADQIFQ